MVEKNVVLAREDGAMGEDGGAGKRVSMLTAARDAYADGAGFWEALEAQGEYGHEHGGCFLILHSAVPTTGDSGAWVCERIEERERLLGVYDRAVAIASDPVRTSVVLRGSHSVDIGVDGAFVRFAGE